MKSFFGGMFINKEKLEKNKIFHPVKLEYYKVKQLEENQEFYGVEIVKTQYKKEDVVIENQVEYQITKDEDKADEILRLLKKNEVMPVQLGEIVHELMGAKS